MVTMAAAIPVAEGRAITEAARAIAAAVKETETAEAKEEETRAMAIPVAVARAMGTATLAAKAMEIVVAKATGTAEEMPAGVASKAMTTAEAARGMGAPGVADRKPGTAAKEKGTAAAILGAAAPAEMPVPLEPPAVKAATRAAEGP